MQRGAGFVRHGRGADIARRRHRATGAVQHGETLFGRVVEDVVSIVGAVAQLLEPGRRRVVQHRDFLAVTVVAEGGASRQQIVRVVRVLRVFREQQLALDAGHLRFQEQAVLIQRHRHNRCRDDLRVGARVVVGEHQREAV